MPKFELNVSVESVKVLDGVIYILLSCGNGEKWIKYEDADNEEKKILNRVRLNQVKRK